MVLLFEQKKKILIPTIRKMPTLVENLIKNNKYDPEGQEIFPEVIKSTWFFENKKNMTLQ